MKNNASLFKKYIQKNSTKEQRPFAGLRQDLKITYRTSSATGNDMLDLLQQLVAGAETDTLDGLKTRLVRLDKLREFLLQSELQGQEQKTVYTAYTKVQTAIRKRKDEYANKHTILKEMLSSASSNITSATFQASEDIPQLRIAMVIGGGLFKFVKKAQEQRKQKLDQRNQELKKDAELYYERELLRGKNTRSQKGKLKKASNNYKDPFAGIENTMVQEGVLTEYGDTGQNTSRRGGGRNTGNTKNDRLIKQIADDVRVVANYYKGKLIRDKDERMDRLEAERERSRGILGRDRDKYGNSDKDGGGSSFLDKWMPAILGPGIWAALKKIPGALKRLPGKLKAIPALIKAAPALITSGLSKVDDFLRPENLAAMPGKALDWVKSLPGKGMSAVSNWWNGSAKSAATGTEKVYNGAIRDPKTGRFVSRSADAAAKAAGAGTTTKLASKAVAIPILGPLLAGGFDFFDRREKGQGLLRSLAGGAVTGVASGLGEAGGTVLGAPGGPVGAFAGGAAGALGGAAAGSSAFDSVLGFLGALNPFSVTTANAAQFGPEEQTKKRLIKDALDTQGKNDPGTTPAAIVPIAKIGKTSDLKEILQSDSNGLGFLFSLKGIDTGDLINAMLGQGSGTAGTGSGSSAPRGGSGGGSQGGRGPGAASGAAALGNSMRRDRGPGFPPPAPGQTEVDQFMQAIGMAETGKDGRPMDDPSRFIRTKGGADSSAYGPYQITKTLAEGALKNTDWIDDPEVAQWMKDRFIPQGSKMLKSSYSDPTYGAGGQGDLNTEHDRAMYMKMSKALMGGTLRDAGGNPLEAAADWRFGESSNAQALAAQDPRYYNEVSKSMQQQKAALAQADPNKNVALAQAQPTENILGENKAPVLNDSKQSAREKAIEEWHQSSDPNKGTASDYLKNKGLAGDSGTPQSGGVEGVDFVIDPDNGERHDIPADMRQARANLTPATPEPQMSESMKAVKERSEKVAASQAAPAPSGPVVVNNNNSTSNNSGSSKSNEESGTARWRHSWERANDIESA